MRAAIAAALFAGPAVLAFFSGGYFDRPRLWAGILAWCAVACVALTCPRPWPRTPAAWLAVGGLAGLVAWTLASVTWTPIRDVALDDAQRLALYLGVLVAGIAVFRSRAIARAVEPALAAIALATVVEGLSERLLPGVFTLERSESVPGRLFQPLTYWNAMGLLAAFGIVLCARLASDGTRPRWLRVSAAGATPVLAMGGYLTLSRGAVLALIVGLAVLTLLRPTRAQVRTTLLLALAAAPAVITGALLSGVRSLEGSASARQTEGLVALAVLAAAALAAGVAVAREARRPEPAGLVDVPLRSVRRGAAAVAAIVAVGVVAVFGVLISQEHELDEQAPQQTTSGRLASAESIRGDFWRVARGAFADEPVRGIGSGGFSVEWLRERTVSYSARDAHSLYFETLAELGLVGFLLLAALLGGVARCAVRAHRRDPGLAAGPIAVMAVWAVHAGLDWDWEMPAVTLVALLLAAVLVARGDERGELARRAALAWGSARRSAPPRRSRCEQRAGAAGALGVVAVVARAGWLGLRAVGLGSTIAGKARGRGARPAAR